MYTQSELLSYDTCNQVIISCLWRPRYECSVSLFDYCAVSVCCTLTTVGFMYNICTSQCARTVDRRNT